MGVDWLDVALRLEKSFNVKIQRGDTGRLIPQSLARKPPGVRCGELHEMVVSLCAEQHVPVPHSSWTRVKLCIMRGCGATAAKVKKDAWLVDDVGCC